jgi:predicted RNA-binding protein YlxR (DUF448 family)
MTDRWDRQSLDAELRRIGSTREGMARLLDKIFGVGAWIYDESENVWIIPDPKHKGPGRAFFILQHDHSWRRTIIHSAS